MFEFAVDLRTNELVRIIRRTDQGLMLVAPVDEQTSYTNLEAMQLRSTFQLHFYGQTMCAD